MKTYESIITSAKKNLETLKSKEANAESRLNALYDGCNTIVERHETRIANADTIEAIAKEMQEIEYQKKVNTLSIGVAEEMIMNTACQKLLEAFKANPVMIEKKQD